MPSFVDVVQLKETVKLGEVEIEVLGLGLDTIGELMAPEELQKLIVGAKFSWATILTLMPGSIRRLLAAAIGMKGDKAQEEAAGKLNAEQQVAILEAAVRVSFPGGVSPFVDRVGALFGVPHLMAEIEALGRAAASLKAQATSASPPLTSS